MGVFGRAAVAAARACGTDATLSPRSAWDSALRKETQSPASQAKVCPRSTFLALCGAGLVCGVNWEVSAGQENGEYAVRMAELLSQEPRLTQVGLWARVAPGVHHNQQADVVISLRDAGLLKP